jgi:CubicO group peptidase (beta-lactamase class C family)
MSFWPELMRMGRRAGWKAGLVPDRTRSTARLVERLLDARGRALFEESGVPGLVVIVRFGEGRTITRCFGRAGPSRPLRPDTVFPALSISKPVTAFCAMALVEQGALDLDEPVWRRLRSFRLPAARTGGFDPDGVTLRRLLSHSAGLAPLEIGWSATPRIPSALELLGEGGAAGSTLRLVEPPGATLLYAGGGFVLVQLLIEDATGMPFPLVARERVLRPLAMHGSDYELPAELAERLATSFDADDAPLPARRLAATAASGLFSTAEDLATFWSVLAMGPAGEPPGRGVISPAACREMLTPQATGPDGTRCGLGFYLRNKRADVRYTHLGYYAGWNHHVEGLLRRRVVVAAMSNGDRGKSCVRPLVHELRKVLYDHAL